MNKTFLASLLALALTGAFDAVSAAPDVPLYDGKTLAQDNLSVSNWGGGSVADSTDLFLFGGHSLKVTTLDLYQGAKINFTTPVALTGSSKIFQVTLQRGAVTLHYDPQTVPGAVQTQPQNTPGGAQGGGGRGRRRGGGGPGGFGGGPGGFGGGPGGFGGGPGGFGGGPGGFGGGPGGFGGGPGGYPGGFGGRGGRGRRNAVAAPLIPLITKLRLEFTLTDGRQADVLQAIPATADAIAGDGWYSVDVPLASLKFGSGPNAMLKSVTLAGDQYGVFFVGRMQLAASASVPQKIVDPAPADAADTDDSADGDTAPTMGGPVFPPPGAEIIPPGRDDTPPGRDDTPPGNGGAPPREE